MTAVPTLQRLMNKVSAVPFSGCWVWLGCVNNKGYGQTTVGRGRPWLVHRLMWVLHGGDLPKGLEVRHSCDVPCCVNPAHLSLGTHRDNMQDMAKRGRYRVPALKGEQVWNAKLTTAAIQEIRSSSLSSSTMGKKFGVSAAHVRLVRRGGVWR